jgi:hypothetical protein
MNHFLPIDTLLLRVLILSETVSSAFFPFDRLCDPRRRRGPSPALPALKATTTHARNDAFRWGSPPLAPTSRSPLVTGH